MYLISVIIPVYNVENYLRDCVNSVLSQKFNDFEIILINDGSTDDSKLIIDEYVEKYSFIKSIDKPNGGLSSARNAGINIASGKYLLFIDSDDFIKEYDSFNNIKEKLDYNVDVLLMDFNKYYFDKTTKKVTNYIDIIKKEDSIDERIKKLIYSGNFISSACNKCIRKNFILENNLFFQEGILSEDVEWSIRLLTKISSIDCLSDDYYFYRQSREGSISTTFSLRHIYDYEIFLNKSIDFINESNISYLRKDTIYNYLAYQYLVLMSYYIEADTKELKEKIKSLNYLLNYDTLLKVKIINLLRKLVGFNVTALLMNKFVRNRK